MYHILIKAFYSGDIACVQKLLKVSHISPGCRIYSECGSSVNLLHICTTAQQVDIFKLLMKNYSVNPYSVFMDSDNTVPYFHYVFAFASESFILNILKFCGVKADFTYNDISLLHFAVYSNCFDVVQYLVEDCSDTDVNITDNSLQTPLHLAYLARHTQIAQYLIQHGADVNSMDIEGCAPHEYIDGDADVIKLSEHLQHRRKIHQNSGSAAYLYHMRLPNLGIDEEEVVSLTMKDFPSLN